MQNDRPPPWPQDQLVEPAAEPVVEVVAVFDETILCARHLREGESFVIGVEPGVDATIAEGLLPIGTLPLVRARGRCHELLIVDELAGTIQLGEKSRSCASLIRSLDALPCPGIAAAHALPLHGGIRACFIVGALTFYVRHTTAARSLPKPRFSCEPTLVTALCSFAILCAWMLILAFAVPSDPALDRGHLAIDTLLRARVENLLARLDRQQAQPALSWDLRCVPGAAGRAGDLASAAAARSRSSSPQQRTAPLTQSRSLLPPSLSAVMQDARSALSVFSGRGGAASRGKSRGCGSLELPPSSLLSGLEFPALGELPSSVGGLGYAGDSSGIDNYGLGRLGGIGRGAGPSSGGSYGLGGWTGRPCEREPPTDSPAQSSVSAKRRGLLAPTTKRPVGIRLLELVGSPHNGAVRRVAMRHLDEFGRCPREDQTKHLILRLVVAPSGAVVRLSVGSQPSVDPALERCALEVASGWHFFPPASGALSVMIPFSFED